MRSNIPPNCLQIEGDNTAVSGTETLEPMHKAWHLLFPWIFLQPAGINPIRKKCCVLSKPLLL